MRALRSLAAHRATRDQLSAIAHPENKIPLQTQRLARRLHHINIAAMSTNAPEAPGGPTATPSTTTGPPPEEAAKWGPQRFTRGRRDVVTAFVQRPDNKNVLVVKRSEKVRTYKLHYGGVSGVVEEADPSLLGRAATEIQEEVGYGPDQVTFVRSGRPLYVDDSAGALAFAVHPFLFELSPSALEIAPVLNWENVEAKFVPPAALATLQTVPQLDETLARVVLTPEQADAVAAIIADRSHGAAQLAGWVLDALEAEVARCEGAPDDAGPATLDRLRNFGYHLATARPSMAPLATAAAEALQEAHELLHSWAGPFEVTADEVCGAVRRGIAGARRRLAESSAALVNNAQELIQDGSTVMTISKSSSVSAAVTAALAAGRRVRAIVCESRPLCEGVAVAREWAAAGAQVTVITEAQAAAFVVEADLVLVGSDAIDSDGVHNKVGTRLLALAAKERGVPFYALADTMKISPGPVAALAHPGAVPEAAGEEKGSEEVIAGWEPLPEGVAVRNVYFEATPLTLVTAVVTEEGKLDAEGIERAMTRTREAYVQAFQLQI